ncbi:hypothetical protein [Gordonia sputi]
MNMWLASKSRTSVDNAIARLSATMPDRITDAGGDGHFALWLYGVDRHIIAALGVGHRDLPDQRWRDRYEADISPAQAASDALAQWRANGDL